MGGSANCESAYTALHKLPKASGRVINCRENKEVPGTPIPGTPKEEEKRFWYHITTFVGAVLDAYHTPFLRGPRLFPPWLDHARSVAPISRSSRRTIFCLILLTSLALSVLLSAW